MPKKHCFPYVYFAGLLVFAVIGVPSWADELRTWTDSTGRFKVEAEFIECEDDVLLLRKENGKAIRMPLDKLSEEDRQYVEQRIVENPFVAGEISEEDAADLEKFAPGKRTRNPFELKPKPVSLQGALEGGGVADVDWSCEPDPAPPIEVNRTIRPVSFQAGKMENHLYPTETDYYIFADAEKTQVLSGFILDQSYQNPEKSRSDIFLGNLRNGQCTRLQYSQRIFPLGFSPNGQSALFRVDEWNKSGSLGKSRHIYIAKISGDTLEPQAAFEPFSDFRKPGDRGFESEATIEWAVWADDQHVLVRSKSDLLILLNIESGKVVWKMNYSGSQPLTLTPGGRYCLCPTSSSKKIVVLETLTGMPCGVIESPQIMTGFSGFGFSPDGKRLALTTLKGIVYWNMADGTAEEPYYVEGFSTGKVQWLDNRFLLVDGNLLDTKTNSHVWRYSLPGKGKTYGKYFWYTTGSRSDSLRLTGIQLPHAKAIAAADNVGDVVRLVQAGMDASIHLDPSIKDKGPEIEEMLREKLTENGLKITDDASLRITLKIDRGEETKGYYTVGRRFMPILHPFHSSASSTEVKYKPYQCTLAVELDGKVVWKQERTSQPPEYIELDELKGSSLQEVVDKSLEAPDVEKWIRFVSIPPLILEKHDCGYSSLGPNGIDDR